MDPPLAVAALLSYLLGSVPTGLWLGLRIRGVDIRQHGSCNIGATNTLRVLGPRLGAAALIGDIAKGVLAALVVSRISPWSHAALVCGLAAILGHTFSVFCRFRGGKGVATSAGVFMALCPFATGLVAIVFAAVLATTRMVSAASCLAAASLAILMLALPAGWPTAPLDLAPDDTLLRAIGVLIALLVIYRHRSNIVRILNGTEDRLGRKRRDGDEGEQRAEDVSR